MDETRAIAHLPNLEIEIVHRRLPDEGAEQLQISLRARPSFEVLGRWLEGPGQASAWFALNPLLMWQRAALALWAPWRASACRLPPAPTPGTQDGGEER